MAAVGPRPAGSRAEGRAHAFVARSFRRAGLRVGVQRFTVPGRGRSRNVIGVLDTPRTCLRIVMAHTDTTPNGPGANDNASGAATVVQLAGELVSAPLESTRLVVLITGSEEAGLIGARAFLDAHETEDWLFVNFDGVGAAATLRYLPEEGIGRHWPADERLIALAERIRSERPELGLQPLDAPTGLTYDATAVLVRGGRALSLVAGDGGRIPNYHQPTDTVENIDREALGRAIAVGRELIALIDRGEAD